MHDEQGLCGVQVRSEDAESSCSMERATRKTKSMPEDEKKQGDSQTSRVAAQVKLRLKPTNFRSSIYTSQSNPFMGKPAWVGFSVTGY